MQNLPSPSIRENLLYYDKTIKLYILKIKYNNLQGEEVILYSTLFIHQTRSKVTAMLFYVLPKDLLPSDDLICLSLQSHILLRCTSYLQDFLHKYAILAYISFDWF